jgi:hypothetical protein
MPAVARVTRSLLYAVTFLFSGLCTQPFSGARAAAWAIAAGVVFVLLVVTTRKRAAGRLDVVLTNVCLILVGAELTLRLVAWVRPSPLFAQLGSDAGLRVESLRQPNKPRPGGVPFNSWGEYDGEFVRKRPGGCLAATIGDSFSVGIVPLERHFTTVAERALECPVYNLGVVQIGPREYKYLMEKEALPLEPDVVVIDLFVGNDLTDDYGCNPSPLRKLFDRENLMLYTVPRRLWAWAGEKRRLGAQAVGVPQMDAAKDFPWLDDPSKEIQTASIESYRELEARRARDIAGPDASKYDRDFFVALDEIVRAAGRTRLAFMLIPDEFQVDDDVWAQVGRDSPGVTFDRDRAQRVIGEWARARGLPCLDLLPALRAAAPWTDGKKHLYHLRDSHFNARGNQVAGQALAEFLRPFLKPTLTPSLKPTLTPTLTPGSTAALPH